MGSGSRLSSMTCGTISPSYPPQTTLAIVLRPKIFHSTLQYPVAIDNLLKHGINNVVILLELALCRTPLVSYHYQVCTTTFCAFP